MIWTVQKQLKNIYDFNSHFNSVQADATSLSVTKRISDEANLHYQKSKLFLIDACVKFLYIFLFLCYVPGLFFAKLLIQMHTENITSHSQTLHVGLLFVQFIEWVNWTANRARF